MADSSPLSTPKRKRTDIMTDDSPSPLHTPFSFVVNDTTASVPISGGSSSPRTKVAHHFRGLDLADRGPAASVPGPAAQGSGDGPGGGGATWGPAPRDNDPAKDAHSYSPSYDMQMQVDENETMMRKRVRISPNPDLVTAPLPASSAPAEIPETPHVQKSQPPSTAADPMSQIPPVAPIPATGSTTHPGAVDQSSVAQFAFDQAIFTSSPKPSPFKLLKQPLPPPSNRPVEAVKSRVRKRAGTPPPEGATTKGTNDDKKTTNDDAAQIVDPIRAALTWHEDEITVYDPEDEDDDGVGINGIGFKPTAAIAHARTMKRRQQLAEYRKREEREARARRNLRRRGPTEVSTPTLDRKESAARRVHFTEAEPTMMIETI